MMSRTRNGPKKAIHALKKRIEEIPADGEFDHNYHMAIKPSADDEHQQTPSHKSSKKGYKLHDRILRPAMVVVYNKPILTVAKATRQKTAIAAWRLPSLLLTRRRNNIDFDSSCHIIGNLSKRH